MVIGMLKLGILLASAPQVALTIISDTWLAPRRPRKLSEKDGKY